MIVRGRWAVFLLIVLGLSLAANMFMLGAAASIRHFGPPGFERSDVARAVPREARRYIRRALLERRSEFRALRSDVKHARERVGDAGRADPFDADEMRNALQAYATRQDRVREVFMSAIVEAVGRMPPDIRQELRLEKFRPGRAFGPSPGGPPPRLED